MSYFKFIKTKPFFLNAGLALIVVALLLWLSFNWVASYTQHNQTVKVPNFTNKPIGELDSFIKDKKLRYQIIDSIYNPQQKPGTVIRQEPEENDEVKENRIIYLYITSVLPPQIQMPKLVDKSSRQAIGMIESYGLKVKIKYVADDCKNCVVKQVYKGKEIAVGTPIKKGSVIELWVGKGNGSDLDVLPDTNQTNKDDLNDEEIPK